MIDKNYFKQTRILDGGMGQELLARGMKPNSTLWSANAILNENYHQLVLDTHVDFLKAGAEIIVTTTFATRQKRLKENSLLDKFEYLNQKAGEIAQAAKKKFPNIYIAGGIPPQNLTYESDDRDESEIRADIYMAVISAEFLYSGHLSQKDRLAKARKKHDVLVKML